MRTDSNVTTATAVEGWPRMPAPFRSRWPVARGAWLALACRGQAWILGRSLRAVRRRNTAVLGGMNDYLLRDVGLT
jgi:hypothetical protein